MRVLEVVFWTMLLVACHQVEEAGVGAAADAGNGEEDGGETDDDTGIDCDGGGVWYDEERGRCWEATASEGTTDGWSAVSYCEELTLAGYVDWQLPSVDDQRSLIRGCAETETGGGCAIGVGSSMDDWVEICEGCLIGDGPGPGGCYWPEQIGGTCADWYWSASQLSDNATFVWNVRFADAAVRFMHKESLGSARCVR